MTEAADEIGKGGTSALERTFRDHDQMFAGEQGSGSVSDWRKLIEDRWSISPPSGIPQVEAPVMMYGYGAKPEGGSWKSTSPMQKAAGEAPPILSPEARATYFADLQKNVILLRSMADYDLARKNIGELLSQLGDQGIFDMVQGKLRMSRALERRTYNKDGSRRRLTPDDVRKVTKPEGGFSSLLQNAKGKDEGGGIAIKPDVLKVGSARFEAPKIKIEPPKVPFPKAPFVMPKLK